MSRYRLVALDLDGTLVDSAPDLAQCLGRALQAEGFTAPTEAQTRGWIGEGIEVLIRHGLEHAAGPAAGRDAYAAVLANFDRCYREHIFDLSRVYEGVPETLTVLRAEGLKLGCITNKRLSFARRLLEQAGLERHFDFVYGGDSFAEKKPSPVQFLEAARAMQIDVGAAVHVGDSTHDLDAASSAGFAFIWAEYGYTSAMLERGALPELRIARFPELRALILGD